MSSSKWIKAKAPGLRGLAAERLAVFSVGLGDRAALVGDIDDQECPLKRDFQAEMRAMFAQYGVEFDDRFVGE